MQVARYALDMYKPSYSTSVSQLPFWWANTVFIAFNEINSDGSICYMQ